MQPAVHQDIKIAQLQEKRVGANATISADVVRGKAKAFEKPGYVLAQLETPLDGVTEAAKLARANGAVFILDPAKREFVLARHGVRIPTDTPEYAINASNMRHWAAPVRQYVEECLAGETGPRGKNFNTRWVASMVATSRIRDAFTALEG